MLEPIFPSIRFQVEKLNNFKISCILGGKMFFGLKERKFSFCVRWISRWKTKFFIGWFSKNYLHVASSHRIKLCDFNRLKRADKSCCVQAARWGMSSSTSTGYLYTLLLWELFSSSISMCALLWVYFLLVPSNFVYCILAWNFPSI